MNTSSILHEGMKKKGLATVGVHTSTQARRKLPLAAGLVLTSLVDAFTLLVIFLLVTTTSGVENTEIGRNIKLPLAKEGELLKKGIIVRLEDSQYFIDDRMIPMQDLVAAFIEVRTVNETDDSETQEKKKALIIQADKGATYQNINPIITAAAQTGFEEIRFAVVPGKDSAGMVANQ